MLSIHHVPCLQTNGISIFFFSFPHQKPCQSKHILIQTKLYEFLMKTKRLYLSIKNFKHTHHCVRGIGRENKALLALFNIRENKCLKLEGWPITTTKNSHSIDYIIDVLSIAIQTRASHTHTVINFNFFGTLYCSFLATLKTKKRYNKNGNKRKQSNQ